MRGRQGDSQTGKGIASFRLSPLTSNLSPKPLKSMKPCAGVGPKTAILHVMPDSSQLTTILDSAIQLLIVRGILVQRRCCCPTRMFFQGP